jgi:hypothetical protein
MNIELNESSSGKSSDKTRWSWQAPQRTPQTERRPWQRLRATTNVTEPFAELSNLVYKFLRTVE